MLDCIALLERLPEPVLWVSATGETLHANQIGRASCRERV